MTVKRREMPDHPGIPGSTHNHFSFLSRPRSGLKQRAVGLGGPWFYWGVATSLILIGVFLSRSWYEALPRPTHMPAEAIKGVTLLQISFVLEGLAFMWLAISRWTFDRLPDDERPALAAVAGSDARATRNTFWVLAVIVAIGVALRLLRLNSDLWGDEISPVLVYGNLSALQVIATYLDSGNHVLNTLLVNASIALFGREEWAIRLPAVVFGIATIPVMYWVGSMALSRQGGLASALLLAVSYHHIYFSQNARGYTAYLFFALLSSLLFIKSLQEDRPWMWALYVITMFLNLASVLNGIYVLCAHVIVGAVVLVLVTRTQRFPMNLLKRLAMVFGGIGLLSFQLYATMLPQAFFGMRAWSAPASGYAPFSAEFFGELVRGVSAGFGVGAFVAALPFLIIAGVGFVTIFQRQWALTLALTLPEVLTAVLLSARGLQFAPRLFLLGLPMAILAAVGGITWVIERATRGIRKDAKFLSSSVATALIVVLSLVSLASLRNYYAIPKQPFRASIQYVQAQRRADEIVVVSFLAGVGFAFYGTRYGLLKGRDYFVVRSAAELDEVLLAHRGVGSFFVTTLPRLLHLTYPDLEARIASGWVPMHTFRATLGGGDITIWKER